MEKTKGQGGRRAQKAQRKASKEKRNSLWAGEETCSTEERGGREIEERGSWEEGPGSWWEEEEVGRGREKETGNDESTKREDGTS